MTTDENEDARRYRVVVNYEEQYSLWPVESAVPAGWNETGFEGERGACLAHIREIWTDMRPLSLRRALDGDRP